MNKRLIKVTPAVGAITTICTLLLGCGQKPLAQSPSAGLPVVETITTEQSTLQQTLPATGSLGPLPNQEVDLVPLVTGTLTSMNVQLGQSVVKGTIVAQISTQQAESLLQQAAATLNQDKVSVEQAQANSLAQTEQTKAGIDQAAANVRSAQAAQSAAEATLDGDNATLQNAQDNLNRQESLYEEGLVAQKDVDSAQADFLTAKSAVEAQKALIEGQKQTVLAQIQLLVAAKTAALQDVVKKKDIDVAKQQVANATAALSADEAITSLYTIRSPITGKVTYIGASSGESVDTTTKIATVANLDHLQLVLNIPITELPDVHLGQTVRFESDEEPGKAFHCTIDGISPQIDPASGTTSVYATIESPGKALRDGMTVSATIVQESLRNVLAVPADAVLSDPYTGLKSVAVVGTDSVLHLTPVTPGPTIDDKVVIESGLSTGQQIAVSGEYGLTDGTKVSIANSQSHQSSQDGS